MFTKSDALRDLDLLRSSALSNWNRTLIRDIIGRHLECFNVVVTVQNLVGIDAVVSIICKFSYFASLAWKCLFTFPNCFRMIWP